MYIIRDVVTCKPGKVKLMLEKFRAISTAMRDMNERPMVLLTDVAGGPFWTLVAEVTVEKIEEFFALEHKFMGNEVLRRAMSDYHELVASGRREIYRIES